MDSSAPFPTPWDDLAANDLHQVYFGRLESVPLCGRLDRGQVFRIPPWEESDRGLHGAREHGEPRDNPIRPEDHDCEIEDGGHRTSVVVFAPCPSTSRYWYARRFGSSKDINGTTGRTPKRPGSRPPPELVRPSSYEASEGTDRPRFSTDKLKGVHAISRHGEECPFSRRSSESPRWSLSL